MFTSIVVVSSALLFGGVMFLARGLFLYASNTSLTAGLISSIKQSLVIGSALVISGTVAYSATALVSDEHEPELIKVEAPATQTDTNTLDTIPRGPLTND